MTTGRPWEPARALVGELRVPGDKSITHRALLLSLIGSGPLTIEGPSPAEDCRSTARAVTALTTLKSQSMVEYIPGYSRGLDFQIMLAGAAMALTEPPHPLDVGNSGTTIRLLAGILAGSRVRATIDGDASIRRRPMRRIVEPLRAMGAEISAREDGTPPLDVAGRPLTGVAHRLPVASAQVKSCLLLAGLLAQGETSIEEPTRSRDHTERMLRHFGVEVVSSVDRCVVKSTNLRLGSVDVPGDLSSAAPAMVAAALLEGSDLLVRDVGLNPTRAGFLQVLRSFGARVDVDGVREVSGEPRGSVRVRPGDRRPLEVAGPTVVEAIDELPLVALLGACAEGETVLSDAAELRVKESDRIAAISRALGELGVDISATPDGFVVRGRGGIPRGGPVDAAGDHRIAMAGAVAGLLAPEPVVVSGWDSVRVSYPGFADDLEALVVR